jgi:hypothetical protein
VLFGGFSFGELVEIGPGNKRRKRRRRVTKNILTSDPRGNKLILQGLKKGKHNHRSELNYSQAGT